MTAVLPEPDGADISTFRDLLVARESSYGDRVFLRFEDDEFTYSELIELSNRIANTLLGLGLQPGDRIAVWMRNRPEYIAVFFAAIKTGLIAVTLNPQARAADGRYLLQDANAKALIFGSEMAQAYAAIAPQLSARPHEFMVGSTPEDVQLRRNHGWRGFDTFYAASAAAPPDPLVVASSPASIIYTSGTTGMPKGVVLPQHAYVNTARWYGQHVVQAHENDVFFTCLPLHHCNAQVFTLATALMRGSTVAMVENFSASRYFDQIRRYDASIFNFIGMMLVALHKQPPRPNDLDNPARCGFGIPVPPDLGGEFERRFGVQLLEGYGATETGCGFVFNTVTERRLGWAGRVLPYAQAKVVGPQGEQVPAGTVGQIVMRPERPDVWMLGYHGDPEVTARVWEDGWLRLDDYGVIDQDGWLGFRGRGLDWVRRRGENISAIEIEDACDQHPSVSKSAVVAVASEMTEEEVKLFVEWRPEVTPDLDDLVAWLSDRLAAYKLPVFIQSVPELPRTATGKMAKFQLDRTPVGEWTSPTLGRTRDQDEIRRGSRHSEVGR